MNILIKEIPEKIMKEIKDIFYRKNIFFTSYKISNIMETGINIKSYEYEFKIDFILKQEFKTIANNILKQMVNNSKYDIYFTKYNVNHTHVKYMVFVDLNKKNIRELKLKTLLK